MTDDLITIDNMDLGQGKEALNKEIQLVCNAIRERPSDKRKGKVVLTIMISGEDGSDDLIADWSVSNAMPPLQGAATSVIAVPVGNGKCKYVSKQPDFVGSAEG